jgi:type IV pilus assembly protein PilE
MDRLNTPGFSLPELLITLSIVAILATITVPSYSGLVAKARRTDAISALVQVQLAQERWRTGHARYAASLGILGWPSRLSSDGHYQLHVDRADSADFLVLARPLGVQHADRCGTFAVDSNGPLYASGYAGPGCWNR